MKPILKRLLWSAGGLSTLAVAGACAGWVLLRQTPHFYRLNSLSAVQREAAATRVEQKLVVVENAAALARASETSARQQNLAPPSQGVIQIQFSQDELNAFFEKWSVLPGIKAGYEKYVTDPFVALDDGQLILAGRVIGVDAIASAHFTPALDAQGELHLPLTRTLAGRLPLPSGLFTSYRQQIATALTSHVPAWRKSAAISSTGVANTAAVSLVMSNLLSAALNDQPADPVLFLPLVNRGSIPVKVLDVKIEQQTLTMSVQPMNAAERAALLAKIRTGQ